MTQPVILMLCTWVSCDHYLYLSPLSSQLSLILTVFILKIGNWSKSNFPFLIHEIIGMYKAYLIMHADNLYTQKCEKFEWMQIKNAVVQKRLINRQWLKPKL